MDLEDYKLDGVEGKIPQPVPIVQNAKP